MKNAKGMYDCLIGFITALIRKRFRWIVCQLDVLQNCLNIKALRLALKSLPTTLDETYARALLSIREEHRDAIRVLQWLVFSAVPLRINEIAEILIAKPEPDSKVDIEERLFNADDILKYCGTLVTTQEPSYRELVGNKSGEANTSRELRLAHFSVQEYLVSQRIVDRCPQYSISETDAHLSIAGTCLTYLFNFADSCPLPVDIFENYPLAGYTAQYWAEHARKTGPDMRPRDLDRRVVRFLDHKQLCTNWIHLYDPDANWMKPSGGKLSRIAATSTYYTLLDLHMPTQILLAVGADVNAEGGRYGSALQAASARGNEAIFIQLLKAGANVNAEGGPYGNALQAASASGYEAIVTQLLKAGANVNAGGGIHGSALQAASASGHEAIVIRLLKAGANVNAEGGRYGSALQIAWAFGQEAIVMQLLKAGANVNAGGDHYGSALQAASASGNEAIVIRLLKAGANVNAEGGRYGSALQAASASGNEAITIRLLKAGANVNAEGGRYGSALQAALAEGHENIISQLLKKGLSLRVLYIISSIHLLPIHLYFLNPVSQPIYKSP